MTTRWLGATSVATLYDIHGNLAALDAVLAEVPDDATIVVGGDVVAGGDDPAETLERLRGLGGRVLWLRGNADRELNPDEPGLAPAGFLDATRAALTEEQIAFPLVESADRADRAHALLPRDAAQRSRHLHREHVRGAGSRSSSPTSSADTVVCGHTHIQFDREIAGKRVVNSGSVGAPYEERARRVLDARPRAAAHRVRRHAPPATTREAWLEFCDAHAVES